MTLISNKKVRYKSDAKRIKDFQTNTVIDILQMFLFFGQNFAIKNKSFN